MIPQISSLLIYPTVLRRVSSFLQNYSSVHVKEIQLHPQERQRKRGVTWKDWERLGKMDFFLQKGPQSSS